MFVRTRNGVYENANPYFIEDNKLYMGWDYPTGIEADFLGDIIAKSESLDKLCDEFVMTHYFKETDYTYRKVLNEDKDLMIKSVKLKKINNKNKAIKNEFNIYGCIWIEIKLPNNKSVFRLEPVAIMNDKGDFELI